MIKNRLKEIRMKEYMLQKNEFANLLNVSPTAYLNWESGLSRPTLDKALHVAQILNKSIHDIWYID